MGRRIPKTRRHKKLKFVDPSYSGPGPISKKKKALPNEPPKKKDYQEISHQFEEFINAKNQIKSNKIKLKKKKKKKFKDDLIIVKRDTYEENEPGMTKSLKPLPKTIRQRRFETKAHFFDRLQEMTNVAIAEAKVEEKYNIEVVDVDESGNALFKRQPKETSERKKEKRKKLKERQLDKKKQKLEDKEFDLKKEKIEFGDIAKAPPSFTAQPRKAPSVDKPGKRKLELKKFLTKDSTTNPKVSIKWKDMDKEQRQNIENERLRAVQMYRILKNKKSS